MEFRKVILILRYIKTIKVMDSVLRFFTCGLTGDECAIILRGGEEICVTANEAWDIEAKAQAAHDAYVQRSERGW